MTRSARGRRDESGVSTRAKVPKRTDDITTGVQSGGESRGGFARLWHAFLYDRSVRARVAVLVLIPLLGALGLGAFLFWNAAEEAANARAVERNASTAVAALSAIARLQDERDVSGLFEVGMTAQGAVITERDRADEAIATLNSRIAEMSDEDGTLLGEAVRATRIQLDLLESYRGARDIDLEPFDDLGLDKYEQVIQALLRFVKATGVGVGDSDLLSDIDALDSLARATETASVERGLISHAIARAADRGEPMGETDRRREAILRGEQNFLLARFVATAAPDFRALYFERMPPVRDGVELEDGTREAGVESLRNTALASEEMEDVTQDWFVAASKRIDVLRDLQLSGANAIVEMPSRAATAAQITAALTAAAVIVVLALTVLLAYAVARSIIRPLRRLRSAALHAADSGLPALVSRIQEDGPAVVRQVGDAVKPEGRDEIGQVASAFNDVHSTAVRVAGEQALLRQNLDTIVVNLSRRTQGLVDRQLGEIEDLESRERDPDQLGTLFRIDHLATRVRRHAESLLVLAGVEEMRRQGSAAPVLDVVRTAVGEVEQYPRIKFGVMPTDLVVPAAVDDIAHLLAELLDNATEFSAPSTAVHVTSQPLLGGGLRLQVADTGLGIPQDQLAALNQRLNEPGDIDVAASRTLGIYVVARLAARHGITVRLVPAEGTTGTIAQVDLPAHLVVSPLDTTDGVLQALQPERQEQQPRVSDSRSRPSSVLNDARQRDEDTLPPARQPSTPARAAQRSSAAESTGQWRLPASSPAPAAQPPAQSESNRQPAAPVARAGNQSERGSELPTRQASTPQPGGFDPGARAPSSPPSARPSDTPAPVHANARYAPSPSSQPPRQPAEQAGNRPPTARSLRGPEPQLPEGDSPIYDAVRSAWFDKGGALDWSSPGDEGWRRAAAALQTAEEAASARRGSYQPSSSAPQRSAPQPARQPSAWTSGGTPGPAAAGQPAPQRSMPQSPRSTPAPVRPAPMSHPAPANQQQPAPVASAGPSGPAGLPVRQRGATLVPGSIADASNNENRPQQPARPKDAGNVASTLSNLQRGVSRGREETGGWVPKRPSDSERSDS
jgi:signal transduction histidine kinase